MDCGTFLLLQSPGAQDHAEVFARATQMAQTADRLGFDSIWCAEHHFSTYGYLSRPLMFAIHLAAQTERIRVGSAVVVLPLHHPLIVAEEIATADLLSGGRLDVGLGRGYQRYEFERLGQTLDQSRERFDESVDILLKAFAGTRSPTRASTTASARPVCSRCPSNSRTRRSGWLRRAPSRS